MLLPRRHWAHGREQHTSYILQHCAEASAEFQLILNGSFQILRHYGSQTSNHHHLPHTYASEQGRWRHWSLICPSILGSSAAVSSCHAHQVRFIIPIFCKHMTLVVWDRFHQIETPHSNMDLSTHL